MSINEIRDTFRGEKNLGDTVKAIGGTVVNIGVDMVVGSLLAAGLCPKKGIKRAVGSLGLMVLSMKIGDMAEEYWNELCDDLKEAFGNAKKELEETAKEDETEKAE